MSEKDNEFEEKELDSEDENDEIENSDEDEENNPDIDPELTKLDNDYLGEQGEDYDKVQPINLSNVMQTSFLDYAMSVIVSRALPDVRDGLKPVHRRILFAMNELGVYSDKPHKKSARIVGDVIGKYHPHGDTAVYEAMVRMAQDFSYRYPLVDGHGNFGSVDGDGAAAMRYTEARMSKLAGEMLRDLNKNTVDFVDNYDGSEKEPAILPARFPNLLVNGASGIAVGMATSIPPHNLTEVINGTLALIENPDITVEKLMEYIPAPDFPTGATIMGLSSVKQAYLTGVGTVTVRAKVNIVNLQNGKKEIVITEIPYQVNKKRLIERIADLAKDKIIDGITDLRDESNRKGMRIIIEIRRDANVNVILNNLYKHTQMQTTYSVNMIALDHGQPRVLNLKQILECYVKHQIEVVTRRTKYDLDKAKARLHIVEGLLIALANIDEVVATIKASKNAEEAIAQLTTKFLLTEIQAKAILDMKLQRLTGLELEKLQEEKKELHEIVDYLEDILNHHEKLMQVIVSELTEVQRKYGDDRRTGLDLSEDLEVEDADLIPEEDVIITITNRGYIKRMTVDTYRAQRRGGKGITGSKMQEDDFIEKVIYTSTHDNLLFFTNFGKVYLLKAYQIPGASRISKGLPLINLLKFEAEEKLAAVINVKSLEEPGYVIFGTKNGIIKKTELIQYKNIRSTGIRAIILGEQDELIAVARTNGRQDIIFGASNGKAACFNESEVRATNRAASGVKGIRVAEGERAIGLVAVNGEEDEITVVTEFGYGKRTPTSDFKIKGRNGKGVKYMNITEKSGRPVSLAPSTGEDDLMIITDKGMVIRTYLADISVIGRDTQGVRVIKLNEGQTVSSIAIVPHQEDAPEEDEEENNVDATNNALHHVDELLQSTEEDLENDDEGTEEDA
ncbi:dNA gyrase subunit A [Firmicutes bacterium CAG:313]|nr:dNA gyrase subunit A [Firmicutes bacterium CAG:313]